jgi:hypothetical protein
MTERDQLAQLLATALTAECYEHEQQKRSHWWEVLDVTLPFIADFLLSKGVRLSPDNVLKTGNMCPEHGDRPLMLLCEKCVQESRLPLSSETEGIPEGAREHVLKCWPGPFAAIERGEKTHEFRRDDRGFQRGDVLRLLEWEPSGIETVVPNHCLHFTGRELAVRVTWVTRYPDFEVPEGYAVMSIAPVPASGSSRLPHREGEPK